MDYWSIRQYLQQANIGSQYMPIIIKVIISRVIKLSWPIENKKLVNPCCNSAAPVQFPPKKSTFLKLFKLWTPNICINNLLYCSSLVLAPDILVCLCSLFTVVYSYKRLAHLFQILTKFKVATKTGNIRCSIFAHHSYLPSSTVCWVDES